MFQGTNQECWVYVGRSMESGRQITNTEEM